MKATEIATQTRESQVTSDLRSFIDDELPALLRSVDPTIPSEWLCQSLLSPVRELLSRPGKEFRAQFVRHSYAIAGGVGEVPRELSLLVELLHAGSLIVDDIQDQSRTRRGAPAIHELFGTPLALNSANWLYFVSLELLFRTELGSDRQLAIVRRAVDALLSCHQGQALDLGVVVFERTQAEVPALVAASTSLKTGSLMALAGFSGAAAAGADPSALEAITEFGRTLGIGLQMLDDLSGIASPRRRHKGDEDLLAGRPTWPWVWAAERRDPVSFARLTKAAAAARDGDPRALEDTRAQLLACASKDEPARIGADLRDALARVSSDISSCAAAAALARDVDSLIESLTVSYR